MLSENDALALMLSDAARCLAVSEDPIFWPRRIIYFLQVFERAATARTQSMIRPAGSLPYLDLALERIVHSLLSRCIWGRW